MNLTNTIYKYISFLLLIIVISSSCDEVAPPTPFDSPVLFSVEGTIDGSPLTIEAGRENVYLFTSYELNENDIYELNADFEKTSLCTSDCEEALSISILNAEIGIQFDSETAISIGDYTFAKNEIDSIPAYEVDFQTLATGGSTIYPKWNFGDGTTSSLLTPTHTFTTSNAFVKLEVQDLLGNKSSVESMIDFENGTHCQKDFYATFDPTNNIYEFRLTEPQSVAPTSSFSWTLSSSIDSNAGSGNTFQTNVQTNEVFEICLDVNENNCTSQICKTFNNQNQQLIAAATFETTISPIFIKNINATLSNIEISYTDDTGSFYSSKNGEQTNQQYFRIVKVTPFEKNENDQPTLKVEAEVKCTLYNSAGEALELESNQLIFAVAYPE